jgi:hypothetical protein
MPFVGSAARREYLLLLIGQKAAPQRQVQLARVCLCRLRLAFALASTSENKTWRALTPHFQFTSPGVQADQRWQVT